MKAADICSRLPERRKRYLADRVYAEWTAAGKTLSECMADPDICQTLYRRLSDLEKSMLAAIVRHIGLRGFAFEELERLTAACGSGADRQIAFLLLRHKSIVFTMRTLWGDRVHFIPRDAFRSWVRCVSGDFPAEDGILQDWTPETGVHVPSGLSASIFRLLRLAGDQGWVLTQKGGFHKKTAQKIASALALDERLLEQLPVRCAGPDSGHKALNLVLDMALRLGLAAIRGNRCLPVPGVVRDWLELTASERERNLLELWCDVHLPEAVWLQHAALALQTLPAEAWVDLDALIDWLYLSKLPDLPDQAEEAKSRLMDRWLKPLAACGWIRLGEGGGKLAVRRVEPDEEDDGIVVQEDFAVVVPPAVPMRLRWDLEQFCEPVALDEISLYRLNRERVLQALEAGWNAGTIHARLAETSATGVPAHVLQALEEWQERFGRVGFADVRLLRCKDETTADEIGRHEELAPYLLERIGPRDFILAASAYGDIVCRLEAMGYAPKRNIGQVQPVPGEGAPEPERPVFAQGIVQPALRLPEFELDPEPPAIEALYPGIRQVPAIWLNGFRAYHESTCKQMIRTAIRYQACLRLRKGDETVTVAPLQLEEGRDCWCLRGSLKGNEVRLGPGDWHEMQLILPGINDKTELIPEIQKYRLGR